MDIAQLLREARTCRRFDQSRPLNADDVRWLVDCARVSPCARNAQVLRYAAAATPAACGKVFPHTHWASALKDWGGPTEGERPTAYIGLLTPTEATRLMHMDTGIAAMAMQLAASARGWGCCMHASFNPDGVRAALNVPEGLQCNLLLAFGVAGESRAIAPMPANGDYNYWRDANSVHHVPKRSVEEVLVSLV